MNREKDIAELLSNVALYLKAIDERYEEAKKDESIEEVLRASVKSALEHLRSALEYSRQDIWESYSRKKGKGCFPYAYNKDAKSFDKSVNENLPGLEVQRPEIYSLLKAMQPFSCGDNWLHDLCVKTNFNKHDSLSVQLRKNSLATFNVAGLVEVRNAKNISIRDMWVDGKQVISEEGIFFSTTDKLEEIKGSLVDRSAVTKEFDWVVFELDGTIPDLKDFLSRCYRKVSEYIAELKPLL